MNRETLFLIISPLFLIFLQVFLCNHLNILGHINPMVYLYFFVFHRLDTNQSVFIALAFGIGFVLDILTQGAGAYTISTLTIAFLRTRIMALNFSDSLQETSPTLSQIPFYKQFLFSMWIVLLHHFLYFLVVYFSFSALLTILKQTFLFGIFTLTFLWVGHLFFRVKK